MKYFLSVLIFLSVHVIHAAVQVKISKAAGHSSFLAIGNPSAIRIEGQGDAPEGELTVTEENKLVKISGEIKMNLKSYSTGIDLRDRHMKEKYFEVDKFEQAILKIENLEFEKTLLNGEVEKSIAFNGVLYFHGVSKPIQGDLFVKKLNTQIQVSSFFKIKLTDFNVNIPTFAGIKVADRIEIKTFNLIEKF
jgi:polyisoprenoid-binding protein YceI